MDIKDSGFKPVKGLEKMEFYFAQEEETCFVPVVKFIEQYNSIIGLLMSFVLDPYICKGFIGFYNQKLLGTLFFFFF